MLKPRILCRSTLFSVLGALVVFAHTVPVWAGGGVKATIADKPEDFGVETRSGPGGVALRVGRDGNVFVAAKDIGKVVLGLKPRTLRNWRCMGKGPRWYQDGQEYYYALDDIEKYITKNGGKTADDDEN